MPTSARRVLAVIACLAVAAPASHALAWGATGHRTIGRLGVASLPPELPAFLHTPEAVEAVGELAREPDRWKAAGAVHDGDRDPAHFVDVDDAGKIAGGPLLSALPPTRSDYEKALIPTGLDSYHAGYLPYSIIDGWQQLAKDFAYWRILTAAIPRQTDMAHKAWMERDLGRREQLILRDAGVWAHYVGDGSQPMHVSIHFNGWGAFPNPNGYTLEKVHAPFEGAFVHDNIGEAAVKMAMRPEDGCAGPIDVCVGRYLATTQGTVQTFYDLQKAGVFSPSNTARGKTFATDRLAAGADELRDLIVGAWAASAHGVIGHPAISVDDVVKRGVDPYVALYGND